MRKLIALSALAMLAACASPRAYNRIDAEARPLIKSGETYLVVTRTEIGTEIDVSNVAAATGGGLIPALIDAGINESRTTKAESLIAPIRDKLVDYDFGAQLEADLKLALEGLGIVGLSDVKLVRAVPKDFEQTTVAASPADTVMFVVSGFSLSSNFTHVKTSASVQVFPANEALAAFKEKPDWDAKMTEPTDNIYRNVFRAEGSLDLAGEMEANASAVSEMEADLLMAALSKASQTLAQQIAADLAKNDDVTSKK